MRDQKLYFFFLLSFFFLFFFESMRQFIASIWFVNMTALSANINLLYLLIFLSPLLLTLLKEFNINILMLLSGSLLLIARLFATFDISSDLYMFLHAMVIVQFCIFFPCFLTLAFSVTAKVTKRAGAQRLIVAAPLLSILLDQSFFVINDGFDASVGGILSSSGETLLSSTPLVALLTLAGFILLFLSYRQIDQTLGMIRNYQRRPKSDTPDTYSPGICMGINLFLLLAFLAYPDVLASHSEADYNTLVYSSQAAIFLFAIMILVPQLRALYFKNLTQVLLISLQLLVLIDIFFIHSNTIIYLAGVAVVSLVTNFFNYFNLTALQNYSIDHFIRLTSAGFLSFLLLFTLSMFSLVYGFLGKIGAPFRDQYGTIVMISWVLMTFLYFRQYSSVKALIKSEDQ